MGVGLVIVGDSDIVEKIRDEGETAWILGSVKKGSGKLSLPFSGLRPH